jgi:hypothetical protein
MEKMIRFFSMMAGIQLGLAILFSVGVIDWETLCVLGGSLIGGSLIGGGLSVATTGGTPNDDIPDEVLAHIRAWRGSINKQFGNVDSLVNTFIEKETDWSVPQAMLKTLTDSRDGLAKLVARCQSNYGSAADRAERNSLLKATVKLCLTEVKTWAIAQFYAKVLTATDVHLLGFFLPGETGGQHKRKEPTKALAEVKVWVRNTEFIEVVIDQAANENSALVKSGWPRGVRQALIVILADDGVTEVYRKSTTRLHNEIKMPEGSKGKMFIIKAAFLRHIDDEPKFGAEPTFSMPLTTEDLAAKKQLSIDN